MLGYDKQKVQQTFDGDGEITVVLIPRRVCSIVHHLGISN